MQRVAIVILLFLSLPAAVWGAPNGERPSPKEAERSWSVLASEPRLDRSLSLSAAELPLGELLERVRAKTGVELAADDRLAPISGYEVTAVVHERPARELLESLVRLYSTRSDRWYWVRQRRGDQTRYLLRNSHPPGATREARAQALRQFLLEQHRRTADFYRRSAREQAALVKTDPYLAALHEPRFFQRNAGFFSFVSSLSEAELLAIMTGHKREISTSQLSPAQRAFIRREFEEVNPRSLTGEPLPGPDQLEKVELSFSGDTIYVSLGAVGSHGVLGGIWSEQALRQQARKEWLAGGGDRQAPERAVPTAEAPARPEELQITRTTRADLLQRLGRLGKLNLLFDCAPGTRSQRVSADYTLAGPLREVLANLERQVVVWKRDGAFLLFRPPDWPEYPYGSATPWPLLRELRATARDNDGYLRPEHWLRLANLSGDQLDRLSEEFPDASQVRQLQAPLRLAAAMSERERALLSRPEGAGRGDWSPETWRRILTLFAPEEARRFRFLLHWKTDGEQPSMRLYFGPGEPPMNLPERPFRKQRPREEAPSQPRMEDLGKSLLER